MQPGLQTDTKEEKGATRREGERAKAGVGPERGDGSEGDGAQGLRGTGARALRGMGPRGVRGEGQRVTPRAGPPPMKGSSLR